MFMCPVNCKKNINELTTINFFSFLSATDTVLSKLLMRKLCRVTMELQKYIDLEVIFMWYYSSTKCLFSQYINKIKSVMYFQYNT